jgi:hypothetical protein
MARLDSNCHKLIFIQWNIDFVKLSDLQLHDKPAELSKPLTRDTEGEHRVYDWSRFCNDPRLSHEKAAKHMIRYLKRTQEEGLIL